MLKLLEAWKRRKRSSEWSVKARFLRGEEERDGGCGGGGLVLD
jgi:hypothetical protein